MSKRQKARTRLAEIALTLKTLRGLTTTELARQLKLDRPNLSAWFGGRPQVLSVANELRICAHLGWRFDQLIASHVHMWKVSTAEDLALLTEFLHQAINPENQRLVITRCSIGNTVVGLLLFIATKDGEGILIRVRRASEIQLDERALIQALGFGEVTWSWRIEDHEYKACWRDESLAIRVADYLSHLPGDGITASALDFASRDWSDDAAVEQNRNDAPDDEDGIAHAYAPSEGGLLKSLMPEPPTSDDRPEYEDEPRYPPTPKEEWLNSRNFELWVEFAWKCASEGFSVQDAMIWKDEALKKISKP